MAFSNPAVGGSTLVRPAIQSPNYQSGVSGWKVVRDGSAEFNNIVIRGGTQQQGQLFIYNGTPAAGNLLLSVSPTAGTDAYGNSYPKGLAVYGSNTNYLITNTGFFVSDVYGDWTEAGSWDSGNVYMRMFSPPQASQGYTDQLQVQYYTGKPNTLTGATNNPQLVITDTAGNSQADVFISGAVTKTDLTGAPLTWQSPSLGTGWGSGPVSGTIGALKFRQTAEDEVRLVGTVHTTSTTPATTMFTLPAAYRPKTGYRQVVIQNISNTITALMATVATTGAVSLTPNPTSSNADVYFNFSFPLGNQT